MTDFKAKIEAVLAGSIHGHAVPLTDDLYALFEAALDEGPCGTCGGAGVVGERIGPEETETEPCPSCRHAPQPEGGAS